MAAMRRRGGMRRLFLTLLGVAAGSGYHPAAAQAPGTQIVYRLVSQDLVDARLRSFAPKNPAREPELRRLFEEAGCTGDALTEESVKGEKAPNLVCTDRGQSDSTIVVGAHFDLVEKGEGVVDNWTGAALLASLFQGIAGTQRRHTFEFVGFTAEEQGLIGSKAFVKQLGSNRKLIRAMINMDTLGLGDTEVWVSHADPELVEWLSGVAKSLNLPLKGVNVEKIGSTDSESFRSRKIPAITIHSLTQNTLEILHSPADTIDKVHLDQYYGTYRILQKYLAVLDQSLK
jgi:hypothetical protein